MLLLTLAHTRPTQQHHRRQPSAGFAALAAQPYRLITCNTYIHPTPLCCKRKQLAARTAGAPLYPPQQPPLEQQQQQQQQQLQQSVMMTVVTPPPPPQTQQQQPPLRYARAPGCSLPPLTWAWATVHQRGWRDAAQIREYETISERSLLERGGMVRTTPTNPQTISTVPLCWHACARRYLRSSSVYQHTLRFCVNNSANSAR